MSLKPSLLLVVEDCHWYFRLPLWPLGEATFVKPAGS
jgi:hypothetical protein